MNTSIVLVGEQLPTQVWNLSFLPGSDPKYVFCQPGHVHLETSREHINSIFILFLKLQQHKCLEFSSEVEA